MVKGKKVSDHECCNRNPSMVGIWNFRLVRLSLAGLSGLGLVVKMASRQPPGGNLLEQRLLFAAAPECVGAAGLKVTPRRRF